jgi:hypothetical protein
MGKLKGLLVISIVLNLILAIWFAAYSSGQEEKKKIISTQEQANFITFKWRVYQILEDFFTDRDPRQLTDLKDECEHNPAEQPSDLEDMAIMGRYDEFLKQGKIKREDVIRTPTGGEQPGD